MLLLESLLLIPGARRKRKPQLIRPGAEDGSGDLTFEKFLNMMAVFSHRTDPEIKMIWAFAIWDFDGDDVIGPGKQGGAAGYANHVGDALNTEFHSIESKEGACGRHV